MGYGIYCEDLEAIGKELDKEKKMINGIKPNISNKTKLSAVNMNEFDTAMTNFLDKLTHDGRKHYERFTHISDIVFRTDGGRKFIKVKYFTTKYDDSMYGCNTDVEGSVHCFVDKTTGNIYKPQSWRAPYTKGNNAVRGNIYDESTYQKTDPHGGWLYVK